MNIRTQSGAAAVTSLCVIILLLIVSMGVSGLSLNSMRRTNRDVIGWSALQAARAGLEHQIAIANEQISKTKGVFKSSSTNLSPTLAPIYAGANVVGEITPLSDPKQAYITATATINGHTKSVRALCKADYYTIWDNVIFAGGGGSGGAVTGNAVMKGSIHILGSGEPYADLNQNGVRDVAEKFTDKNGNGVWDPGEPFTDTNGDGVCNINEPYQDLNNNRIYDVPLTQLDAANSIGGTAAVGNNYAGMPSDLRAEIVAPPKTSSGLDTLNAIFRVRRGAVKLSGNATIGAPSAESGGKGKMDAVFVNNGFTGKGPSAVYSDNGTKKGYDMEAMDLHYPLISGVGADPYIAANGSSWTTHEDYLNATALTVPIVKIDHTQAAFTYSDVSGNSISYIPPKTKHDSGLLTVNGIIRVDGNLSIGAGDTTRYQGRGTIFATNNIYIDGNLRPLSPLKFPRDTALGFIAKNDLLAATASGSSHLYLSGAFYAQGRIVSSKQNEIAGTFVGNTYTMNNVPAIYQVPSLVDYMPPAMPGDGSRAKVTVLSWRLR